jgi:hypothetical protein
MMHCGVFDSRRHPRDSLGLSRCARPKGITYVTRQHVLRAVSCNTNSIALLARPHPNPLPQERGRDYATRRTDIFRRVRCRHARQMSCCSPEGCQKVARGRSGAQTPGQVKKVYCIPEGCQSPSWPPGFWHPSGVLLLATAFRGYRSQRFAQPPATIFHPSGMTPFALLRSRTRSADERGDRCHCVLTHHRAPSPGGEGRGEGGPFLKLISRL